MTLWLTQQVLKEYKRDGFISALVFGKQGKRVRVVRKDKVYSHKLLPDREFTPFKKEWLTI